MNPGSLSILFNCTTNIVGGGVKNSALFIEQAINDPEVRWTFAISPQVGELLKKRGVDVFAHCFEQSPARSRSARDKLRRLVWDEKPDCVYTMAGPAYVKFNVPHIMGLSNPYVTHAGYQQFMLGRRGFARLAYPAQVAYTFLFSRLADAWVFQTASSCRSFIRRARIPQKKCYLLPNAFDGRMSGSASGSLRSVNGSYRIFCPMAPYWHKGAHLVPNLARALYALAPGVPFQFALSLPFNCVQWRLVLRKAERLGVGHMILNIGPYNYTDLPSISQDCLAFFVPSVLETFSASYLESYGCGKPLIAWDADFMRAVCGNAVIPVKCQSYNVAADKIIRLLSDEGYRNSLVADGRRVLERQISQQQRYALAKNMLYAFLSGWQ